MENLTLYWAVILAFSYPILLFIKKIRLAFHPELSKIPGPFFNRFTDIPITFRNVIGDRAPYIHALHKQYGPYVRIGPYEVSVADIEGYKQIHKVGSQFTKSPWYQGQSPQQHSDDTCGVFGIVDVRKAANRRRYFQQAGTKKIVHEEWEDQIVDVVKAAVAKIKADAAKSADIFKWWTLMTSDVLGSFAFGKSYDGVQKGEKTQILQDFDVVMILGGIRKEMPWIWTILSILPFQNYTKIYDRLTENGEEAVRNTKLAVQGRGEKTIFSKMYPEDGVQPFPDSLIAQEAGNLIIAGSDTTAMTLTFLVYAVLTNSDVKEKLFNELKTISANPKIDELESKPYLNNTIQETLRLYPTVGSTLRRIVPAEGAVMSKYKLPGGVQVDTQAWTFHQDPNVFPNPERFNPDRWNDATPEMKEYFMGFGGMARSCLGQNVARLQMLHAVTEFFREIPNARLADSTTPESMEIIDYFVIKPKSGKCEITTAPHFTG